MIGTEYKHIYALRNKDTGNYLLTYWASSQKHKALFSTRKKAEEALAWLEKQGEQKPTEDVKTLDAYKVIAWLNENVADFWRNPCNPNRVVNQFKKDFGL